MSWKLIFGIFKKCFPYLVTYLGWGSKYDAVVTFSNFCQDLKNKVMMFWELHRIAK